MRDYLQSRPNKPAAPNAGIASCLPFGHPWPGVGEPGRRRQRTHHQFMNTKQKTLTYIAVAAIGLTSLFAAWDLTGRPNHTNVTRYAPIIAPPNLDVWAKRELASSVFWSWLVIGGMYSLMLVALRDTSAQTRRQMDEQVSAA